jgi:hypothetical protein
LYMSGTTLRLGCYRHERRCHMPERTIPEWAAKVGAEVRDRTEQLAVNELYLIDVTDLLQVITEREFQRRREGDEQYATRTAR